MKCPIFVILMFIIAGCSTSTMVVNDKTYCDHLDDTLQTNWSKNTKRIITTVNFIKDFDEHYYKCFINKDSNFLVTKLGKNYIESLPLAKKNIVDSLLLIKAFEYPIVLSNDSSKNQTSCLFMMNKDGKILYYRRIQIIDNRQQ